MTAVDLALAGLVLAGLLVGGWWLWQLNHENAGLDRDLTALERRVASLQSAQATQVTDERSRARAAEGLFRGIDENLRLISRRQGDLERQLGADRTGRIGGPR